MTTAPATPAAPLALLPLRQELELFPGPDEEDGSPTWSIHDPLSNAFFRIDWTAFEIISRWQLGSAEAICREIGEQTPLCVTPTGIKSIHNFLVHNQLVQNPDQEYREPPPTSLARFLIKNYLFFRIPICNPNRFLNRTLGFIAPLFNKKLVAVLAVLAALALYVLISRFTLFSTTFLYFFSVNGLLAYALTLFAVKLLHELGHIYTAKYYGLNVSSMGIAFLVMWPVLYSDNTDAWRLPHKRARMTIVAAGTLVELGLAVLFTFLWLFFPPGILQSCCFLIAAVSWISSLMINLSPFMRFDGYYFLSDWLDVPNLAPRAFALGTWQLRRFLFGIQSAPPETFSRKKRNILIAYAYTTWLYRLILFTGIALLVYHLFFKVLGIILFLVEIYVFVLGPIVKEIAAWWHLRGQAGAVHRRLPWLLVLLAFLSLIPLPAKIISPAFIQASGHQIIYPPFPAKIKSIHVQNGETVAQGQLLFVLTSPRLDMEIELSEKTIAQLKIRLKREQNSGSSIEKSLLTHATLFQHEAELAGYLEQRKRLSVHAPFAGRITAVPPWMRQGSAVNRTTRLGAVFTPDQVVFLAYLREEQLEGLDTGRPVFFYPEHGARIVCRIKELEKATSMILQDNIMASVYGGELPVREDREKRLVLEQGYYRVWLTARQPLSLQRVETGHAVFSRPPYSRVLDWGKKILAVLIRESGF